MYRIGFYKLTTARFETKVYHIKEDYSGISVVTVNADVLLVPSENGLSTVKCFEQKKANHSVSLRNGILEIRVADMRSWYDNVGIKLDRPRITVYVPRGKRFALSVKSPNCNVRLDDCVANGLFVKVDTGQVSKKI